MRTIAIFFLLSLNLLHASVGTPIELVFPTGSAGISGTFQAVAMNDRYIVVGSHGAMGGAGEAHVFSSTTGANLRRLRASQTSHLGARVAVSGNRAFVSSGAADLLAFDLATGRQLWRVDITDLSDSALGSIKHMTIDSLAADGDSVLIGMMSAWATQDPAFGFYMGQGATLTLHAATGASRGLRMAGDGQEFSRLGRSVAVAGPLQLAGEPYRDINAQDDAGRVLLHNSDSHQLPISFQAQTPAAGDMFGSALAVAGLRFFIGAPQMDHSGKTDNGRVYVYSRQTTGLIKILDAPASLPNNARFGDVLAGCGSLAVIGGLGHAWLYDCVADQLTALVPGTATTSNYGRAVAVCSHSAVVADSDSTGGSAAKGRVHLFRKVGRVVAASQVIASTGQDAPGTTMGTRFSNVTATTLSNTGKVAHLAAVRGGGTTSTTNAGVWSNLGGTHDLVLRKGDVIGGKRFAAPTQPFFSPTGTTGYFLARQTTNGRQHVFTDDGFSFAPMVGEGDSVAAGVNLITLGKLHEVVPCSYGGSLFASAFSARTGVHGVTRSTDSFVGRRSIFTFMEDAHEGQPSPVDGFNYGQIAPRVSAFEDHIAFITALAGAPRNSNSAVIVKNLSSLAYTVSARRGNVAHGTSGAKYRTLTSVQMQKDQVVYKATLSGGAAGVNSGLWRNGAAIAIQTAAAPGMPAGVKFRRILDYFNAGSYVTIFRAQVSGPGITSANDVGVWVNWPGGTQLLVREGGIIPNSGGQRVGVIQRVDADVSGNYAILVSLTGADRTRNQALLAGSVIYTYLPSMIPTIVMHKGSFLNRPTPKAIRSIVMATNHLEATGAGSKAARQVNGHGVLVSPVFADSRDLLLLKH